MFGHIPEGYYQQLKRDDDKIRIEQLRDQFAMAALPGLLNKDNIDNAKLAAQVAYAVADRMLEARKEKK